MDPTALARGLERALAREGWPPPHGLSRLTGGAMMESWLFASGDEHLVLRRAPSPEMMERSAYGHDVEAQIISLAHAGGVTAPEIIAQLAPEDGIGTGFIMRALPGTADPRSILACRDADSLLRDAARELAVIHALDVDRAPAGVPHISYADALAGLREQFRDAGNDRPIIALAIAWLEDNIPDEIAPVVLHGDFRLGNLLVDDGRLSAVLDWELVHLGDRHEDIAYACMTVWRFARIDRPALGLGSFEDWFAAYEAAGGAAVDRARVHYWLVYRTCWWALGCLGMARYWRSGEDRSLERVVISRRTAEQELDLLMLLEESAPQAEQDRPLPPLRAMPHNIAGEASTAEIATAISEWLATIKDGVTGHDRFQLAVARNALGVIARGADSGADSGAHAQDFTLAQDLLTGAKSLATPHLLANLRRMALGKLAADMPKYPALALARARWGDITEQGEQ